jgi:hypothetical protein
MGELESLGALVCWVTVAWLRSRTVHQARGRKLVVVDRKEGIIAD